MLPAVDPSTCYSDQTLAAKCGYQALKDGDKPLRAVWILKRIGTCLGDTRFVSDLSVPRHG